jgi:TusA-related sulfurtransferase
MWNLSKVMRRNPYMGFNCSKRTKTNVGISYTKKKNVILWKIIRTHTTKNQTQIKKASNGIIIEIYSSQSTTILMIQKLVNMFGELVFIGTKVEWWRFRFETVGQVHEMYPDKKFTFYWRLCREIWLF